MLEEKLKSLDEDYLNMIVHEIKNPLSLIKVNVDYIALCDKTKRYAKNIAIIDNEIEKANALINGLLRSNSAKFNKMQPELTLGEIILKVVSEYKESYSDKIYFIFDDNNQKIKTSIPHQELSIVLSNLIKNSVEAILPGSGEIKINILDFPEFTEIEIIDDGPGVQQNISEKLQEKSHIIKKNSSGLGLSICKNILFKYNATLTLNNYSEGAIARICFPK